MCTSLDLFLFFILLMADVKAFTSSLGRLEGRKMCLKETLDDAPQQAATLRPPSKAELIQDLMDSSVGVKTGELGPTFFSFAENEQFIKEVFQKRPFYCGHALPNVAGAFTMQDVQVLHCFWFSSCC